MDEPSHLWQRQPRRFMLYSERVSPDSGISQEFQRQLIYALEHSDWVTASIKMVAKDEELEGDK